MNTRNDGQDEIFGWSFRPSGAADRVFVNGDPPMVEIVSSLYAYSFDASNVKIELFYDRDHNFGPCPNADPSCIPMRRRVWQPVAMRGGYLYLLEHWMEVRGGTYTWDDTRGAWVNANGNVLDVEDRVYAFLPRLDAYRVEPLPTF